MTQYKFRWILYEKKPLSVERVAQIRDETQC